MPASERSRLSTKSCRTMRERGAPNAERTASSRRRPVPRMRRRFATLAHAIRRRNPTDASNTQSGRRTPRVTSSSIGKTLALQPLLLSGRVWTVKLATRSMSCWGWRNAKRGEELGSDLHALNGNRPTLGAEIGHQSRNGSHRLERLRVVVPIEKIERIHDVAGTVMLDGRLPHADQPLGLRIRQRTEKNGVHHAENGGVGADAESEREYGDGGEARAALQHAEHIAEIAGALVEPANDVHGASVFLEERRIAEALLCIEAGGLGRHAHGEIVRSAHLEVGAQLFVEFAVQLFLPQQALQSCNERHDTPPFQANRRTWATASVRRSQFFSSSASCLRPAEVRR